MGVVSKWSEPKTAAELGRLIETFLTSEFGWGAGGGSGDSGAELDYELDGESATVLVGETSELFAMKRMLDGDGRFELLDAEERELIAAYRAKRDDVGAGEPRAVVAEDGAVEGTFTYEVEGLDLTFRTWAGPADEWDAAADERSALDFWNVSRAGDVVQAVQLVKTVVGPPSGFLNRIAASAN